MKSKKSVSAELHGITGRAFNKRDAELAARLALDSAVARLKIGPILARVDGVLGTAITMAIPTAEGWASLIVQRPNGDCERGLLLSRCSSFMWENDQGKIARDLTLHAAHLVWDHAETDDADFIYEAGFALTDSLSKDRESLRDDLSRWVAFQRSYKKAIDSGADPATAHATAGGYRL